MFCQFHQTALTGPESPVGLTTFFSCPFCVNPLSKINSRYLTSVVSCDVCPERIGSCRPFKSVLCEWYCHHLLWIDRQQSLITPLLYHTQTFLQKFWDGVREFLTNEDSNVICILQCITDILIKAPYELIHSLAAQPPTPPMEDSPWPQIPPRFFTESVAVIFLPSGMEPIQ